MSNIPSRLGKDPIVEAVCEIRFSGKHQLGGILPGLLYSALRESYPDFEKLPLADLPSELAEAQPNLKYAAKFRLRGSSYIVSIGESVLAVGRQANYPGWPSFIAEFEKVWAIARDSALIESIERISVKYVNLFELDKLQGYGNVLNADLRLGSLNIEVEPTMFRTEFKNGSLTSVVQIAQRATAELPSGKISGVILDIDVIDTTTVAVDGDLRPLFERAHSEEKRVFFDLLKSTELAARNPEYAN